LIKKKGLYLLFLLKKKFFLINKLLIKFIILTHFEFPPKISNAKVEVTDVCVINFQKPSDNIRKVQNLTSLDYVVLKSGVL
jgi:hypothetical protein